MRETKVSPYLKNLQRNALVLSANGGIASYGIYFSSALFER